MDDLFGNIDRKIRQVFPWRINTLTCLFTSGVWGGGPAHTPLSPFPGGEWGRGVRAGAHTPLSPFPGGEWGRGVRAGAHTPLRGNLFISFLIYSKERRIAVFPKTASLSLVVLKRAPHYHVLENGVFFKFLYSKERRRAVFQTMGIFKVRILKIAPHGVFLKLEYF